ncbi:hypothetical protein ID866_13153, partial [Astraeus odoratus]
NTGEVPTVTDNLYAQGTISSDSIGISYQPSTSEGQVNGELNFGGLDTSKITGQITYVPITSTPPASHYWGIDQDVTYGESTTILLAPLASLILVPPSFSLQLAYQRASGATLDQDTGLLTLTQQQYDKLQSLYFNIGGTTLEFTPNAQIWPRALNSILGGDPNKIYLITSDLGSPSGSGLDFINSFGWLQRFYSVYDTANTSVGIATTPFTDATTN